MTARDRSSPSSDRPRRRWRRWLLVLAGGVIGLVLVLRAVVPLLLPSVLADVAASSQLSLEYDRLDMSWWTGDVELWHVVLGPLEGGEDIAHLEYVRVDVSVVDLLVGGLVVRRAEVDGLDLRVGRDAEGRFILMERMRRAREAAAARAEEPEPAATEDEDEVAEEDTGPRAFDFGPPLVVDALRAQHMAVHLRDETHDPPFEVVLSGNLRLSSLGSSKRPARFGLELSAWPVLDSFTLEGEGSAEGRDLDARLSVRGRGIRPGLLASELAELGIAPVAEQLDLSLDLSVRSRAVDPESEESTALTAQLGVHDVVIQADGRDEVVLDAIDVEVLSLDTATMEVGRVAVTGVRAGASRDASGALRVAGLALTPTDGPPAPPPEPDEPTADGGLELRGLDELIVSDVVATWTDESLSPAAGLSLRVDELSIANVENPSSTPASLRGRLAAPGLAEDVRLDGELVLFAERRSVDLRVALNDIGLAAAEPFLGPAGVMPTFDEGRFTLGLRASAESLPDGTLVAELGVSDIELRDGEDVLFGLATVAVDGVSVSPGGAVRVESVDVSGSRLTARRADDGALHALGLRIAGAGAAAETDGDTGADADNETDVDTRAEPADDGTPRRSVDGAAPPAGPSEPGPPIEVARLRVHDHRIDFVDETMTPPHALSVADVGVELTDFVLGGADPAALSVWLEAPGVLDRLALDGAVRVAPPDISVELELTSRGVTARELAPYLEPAGIGSELADGRLSGQLSVQVAEGPVVDAELTGLSWRDGDRRFLAVDRVGLVGLAPATARTDIAAVEVQGPWLWLERDGDGALHAMGMRVAPPAVDVDTADPTGMSPPAVDVEADDPSGAPPSTGDVLGASGAEAARSPVDDGRPAGGAPPAVVVAEQRAREAAAAPPSILALDAVNLTGLRAEWADRAVSPPVETAVTLDVAVEDLVLGGPPEPARVDVSLGLDGALDELFVRGEVTAAADSNRAALDLGVRGLRAGSLGPYLPPTLDVTLVDGRFEAHLDVQEGTADDGGRRLDVALMDVGFRDGEAGDELFGWDALRVVAPRLDPEGGRIAVDEVSLTGVRTEVVRDADGRTLLLGLAVDPAASSAGDGGEPVPPAPADVADVAAPVSDGSVTLGVTPPHVTLETLDVHVARVAIDDASARAPLVLTDLRLSNPEPWSVLGDPDEVESRPVRLALDARLDPVFDSLDVDVVAAPFDPDPELTVDVALGGLDGDGLLAAVPGLADSLDASELRDGSISAHLEAVVKARRRDPLDFDLSRGFGLELLLGEVAMTSAGEQLVGLEELRVDATRIEPATGKVAVREVEILEPMAVIGRSAEGLHVAGLTLKPAPEETEGDGAPSADADETRSSADDLAGEGPTDGDASEAPSDVALSDGRADIVAAAESPTDAGGDAGADTAPDVTLDHFILSGIDLTFTDTTAEPMMELPLTGLDLEVRGLSTRGLAEGKPVRYQLLIESGDVVLPQDARAHAEDGAPGEPPRRAVFGEISVRGDMALAPHPAGRTRAEIVAMELGNFEGPAAAAGVALEGGVLDAGFDLRFAAGGALDARANITLTDLDLSEPADGPIRRILKLPTPLDTVLFVLRDEDGAIRLPLQVDVGADGISVAEITVVALQTLGTLIVDAIAASPLRVVGTVAGLAGMGAEEAEGEGAPLTIEFDAASTTTNAFDERMVAFVRERLLADERILLTLRHEFGLGDLARERILANPSPEQGVAIAESLRMRRDELLRERGALASRARAAILSGQETDARRHRAELRTLDHELGVTEDALDAMLSLASPGAERKSERRARQACIELGRERLQRIAHAVAADDEMLADRIRVVRPSLGDPTREGGGQVTLALTVSVGP